MCSRARALARVIVAEAKLVKLANTPDEVCERANRRRLSNEPRAADQRPTMRALSFGLRCVDDVVFVVGDVDAPHCVRVLVCLCTCELAVVRVRVRTRTLGLWQCEFDSSRTAILRAAVAAAVVRVRIALDC